MSELIKAVLIGLGCLAGYLGSVGLVIAFFQGAHRGYTSEEE